MALNPCIADSDCISLGINEDSNLVAELLISVADGNCAECTVDGLYVPCAALSADLCNGAESREDGLWVPEITMEYGVTGPPTSPYGTLNVAGPLGVAGPVIARSGSVSWTAPDCGDSIMVLSVLAGPVQFTDVSVGGRVQADFQTRILPAAYAGGPYALYRNSGTVLGEIAWPQNTSDAIVRAVGAGVSETMEWKQSYEVTAGSVGSLSFRAVYIYVAFWAKGV